MKSKIKTLMIEPGKSPIIYYIEPTMKAFRDEVNKGSVLDGDIEAKRLDLNVYAIFHKDRFLTDLQPNRRLWENDIISGTIFIVATDDNKQPVSLKDYDVHFFALKFWNAETFDDMDVMEANMNTMLSRLWQDV